MYIRAIYTKRLLRITPSHFGRKIFNFGEEIDDHDYDRENKITKSLTREKDWIGSWLGATEKSHIQMWFGTVTDLDKDLLNA